MEDVCPGNSIYNLSGLKRAKIFQNTVYTGGMSVLPNNALQKFLTSLWDYQDSEETMEKVYSRFCRPILLLVRLKKD